jgi:hypothetical protein
MQAETMSRQGFRFFVIVKLLLNPGTLKNFNEVGKSE